MDRPASFVGRAQSWLSGQISRFLGVGVQVGIGSGARNPARSPYPVERSMAAFGQNPWVFVCVQAVATDLGGLRLVAQTGEGTSAKQTTDHWLLKLLKRPSPKVGGLRFRKQLYADLKLTSNAYIRVYRQGGSATGRPVMLGRIPPQLIEPDVGDDGEELGWILNGRTQLKWHEVLHVSDISIESDTAVVIGTSAMQPLALGLQVDRDSRRQAGRAARRGRLEMMLTPKDGVILGQDRVDAATDQYARAAENGDGIYVIGAGMDAHPLTYTARDGEFLGISKMTKDEILAAMQVPPVRAGDPAANYGTAKQQMRTYWESLRGLAALVDDELSRLTDDGAQIVHSFAGVEALQTSYTERQARAVIWIQNFGMDPDLAAVYEGFVDAPIKPGPAPTPVAPGAAAPGAPKPPKGPKVDEPRVTNALRADLGTALALARELYDSSADVEETERSVSFFLRSALTRAGSDRADVVADEAAKLCSEASCARSPEGDMLSTRAFEGDHVSRIIRMAGL